MQWAMIVKHLHGLLKIVELFGIDPTDLIVADFFAHDELVELLSRRVFSHV